MADLPDAYYTHAAEVLRKTSGIPSMLSLRRAEKRRLALIKRKAENEAKAKVSTLGHASPPPHTHTPALPVSVVVVLTMNYPCPVG